MFAAAAIQEAAPPAAAQPTTMHAVSLLVGESLLPGDVMAQMDMPAKAMSVIAFTTIQAMAVPSWAVERGVPELTAAELMDSLLLTTIVKTKFRMPMRTREHVTIVAPHSFEVELRKIRRK